MINELELMARRDDWSQGVSIYGRSMQEGKCLAAQTVVFNEHPSGTKFMPMLILGIHEAQRLMDELWGCGLRPSEGTGSAGSLAATERHLKDMQNIAMGFVNKTLRSGE
jgi:hypothetical protein